MAAGWDKITTRFEFIVKVMTESARSEPQARPDAAAQAQLDNATGLLAIIPSLRSDPFFENFEPEPYTTSATSAYTLPGAAGSTNEALIFCSSDLAVRAARVKVWCQRRPRAGSIEMDKVLKALYPVKIVQPPFPLALQGLHPDTSGKLTYIIRLLRLDDTIQEDEVNAAILPDVLKHYLEAINN